MRQNQSFVRRNLARKSNWEKIIHFCPRCIFAANFASGHFGLGIWFLGVGFGVWGIGFAVEGVRFRDF